MRPLSLYVHIPYCEHKCIYCDFYSVVNFKNISGYFSALKKEIEIRAEEFANTHIVRTIYFGGGTPTLVPKRYLEEILNFIAKKFKTAETLEITMEANPETLNESDIADFLSFGINRLSVGVQSFYDDDLSFLTRIHNSRSAIDTVETAFRKGFENINIDLIFNLPRQTKERWLNNLQTATKLPIKHISAYSLIIERGTILNKMIIDGQTKIGDDDYDAELYEITQSFLKSKNFVQYEVSNFSKSGYECKHNLAYWTYDDYLGFGTAAHSFVRPQRWQNFRSLSYYLNSLKNKDPFVSRREILSPTEQTEEYVMLALRSKGLNVVKFEKMFGKKFFDKNRNFLDELIKKDFIVKSNDIIKFTDKGYAICDEILLRFEYR